MSQLHHRSSCGFTFNVNGRRFFAASRHDYLHLRSKTRFFAQFHIIFGVNQINETNIDVSVRMLSSMPTDRHLFKYFPISKDFLWWCTHEFLSSALLFNIANRYANNSCLQTMVTGGQYFLSMNEYLHSQTLKDFEYLLRLKIWKTWNSMFEKCNQARHFHK